MDNIDSIIESSNNIEFPASKIGMRVGQAKNLFRHMGLRVPLILRGMKADEFVWLYRNGATDIEIEPTDEL